jgi:hypothetical protein
VEKEHDLVDNFALYGTDLTPSDSPKELDSNNTTNLPAAMDPGLEL